MTNKLEAFFLPRTFGIAIFMLNFRKIFQHLLWLKQNKGKFFLLELQAAWQLRNAESYTDIFHHQFSFTMVKGFDCCVSSFRASLRSQYERDMDAIIRRNKHKFYFF